MTSWVTFNPRADSPSDTTTPAGELPRMARIQQRMPRSPPLDYRSVLAAQLTAGQILSRCGSGSRIAVCVGSRGISDLLAIVAVLLELLREAGAQPLIVPSMGSHGGATPEGQRGILAEYGITESALGVPIRDSMEVLQLGETNDRVPVWTSVAALEADGMILVNRVKPHTDFSGELGSGLIKMSVVGLGKQRGAVTFHAAAARSSHLSTLRAMSKITLAKLPILAGLAILEGFYHEITGLVVVERDQIARREPELLIEAVRRLPRLPVNDIDLLVIDRIGKNVSGTGMDPNVTGRYVEGYRSSLGRGTSPGPTIRRILVRGLTPETRGNAIGIGMADFTTTRLVQAIDLQATFTNALTALSIQAAKIPIYFPSDRTALAGAIASLGLPDPRQARIVRIQDTQSLAQLEVSDNVLEDLRDRAEIELLSPPREMRFDACHNLCEQE